MKNTQEFQPDMTDMAKTPKAPHEDQFHPDEGGKILVMYEDKKICDLFRNAFCDSFSLLFAHNTDQALNFLQSNNPSVLFLDSNFNRDGQHEILNRIHERAPDILVVLIVDRENVDDAPKALEHGADFFIMKPFDVNKLRYRTKQLLKMRGLKNLVKYLRRAKSDETHGAATES